MAPCPRMDEVSRSNHKSHNAGRAFGPSSAPPSRAIRFWAGIAASQLTMVRENESEGKVDPSRAPVPGGVDTPVGGPDGRGGLPGSVDVGSWRRGVVGDVLRCGNQGYNSAAPDHNAGRSRTLHGIQYRGKRAAGDADRQEWPCPSADGAGQWQPIMAG